MKGFIDLDQKASDMMILTPPLSQEVEGTEAAVEKEAEEVKEVEEVIEEAIEAEKITQAEEVEDNGMSLTYNQITCWKSIK